jgi:hypothetical protein
MQIAIFGGWAIDCAERREDLFCCVLNIFAPMTSTSFHPQGGHFEFVHGRGRLAPSLSPLSRLMGLSGDRTSGVFCASLQSGFVPYRLINLFSDCGVGPLEFVSCSAAYNDAAELVGRLYGCVCAVVTDDACLAVTDRLNMPVTRTSIKSDPVGSDPPSLPWAVRTR